MEGRGASAPRSVHGVEPAPHAARDGERLRLLGAYRRRGWFTSVAAGTARDRDGGPLPLLTYPAIDWLDSVLAPDDCVFEYGMGGSTLWFAKRVAHVTSVDHSREWVESLHLPRTVTARVATCGGDLLNAAPDDPYVRAIDEDGRRYDVVVIDGMARLSCVPAADRALTPTGLIIFDNSDKPDNATARERLAEWDYARIDFCGTRPGSAFLGCTSVYSKAMDFWLRRARAPRYWGRSLEEHIPLSGPDAPLHSTASPPPVGGARTT